MGLDFFGLYGLSLVFVPHWNNTEGGSGLDTSRCYMGQERFDQLLNLLPPHQTVVGIDEHTALILDLENKECRVMGKGSVTLLNDGIGRQFQANQNFSIDELGSYRLHPAEAIVPPGIWERVSTAQGQTQPDAAPEPSAEVLALVEAREVARTQKDWATADKLRDQISDLGWTLMDTPQGPQLQSKGVSSHR